MSSKSLGYYSVVLRETTLVDHKNLSLGESMKIFRTNFQLFDILFIFISLGRSHTTGEEGQYPLKNLRKTSETDAWTLQKYILICF